jgi:hypothetical protein
MAGTAEQVGAGRPRRGGAPVFVAVAVVALIVPATPASALTVRTTQRGLDTCEAPSVSQMRAFWTRTPYGWFNMYIGGSMRACPNGNLSSTWISQVGGMGWKLLPTWVGPQAPCSGFRLRFSSDPGRAYDEGRSEAAAAMATIRRLKMSVDTPLVYDLESFNTTDAGCLAAARAFVHGWTSHLALAPRQVSGLYGSVCGSGLDAFASIPRPPDFIWGAWYNGNPDVNDMVCVSRHNWVYGQRHKQYAGGHNETWNGVTLHVDNNASNGPVYRT